MKNPNNLHIVWFYSILVNLAFGFANTALPIMAISQESKISFIEFLFISIVLGVGIANLLSVYALIKRNASFFRFVIVVAILDTVFGGLIALSYWLQIQNSPIYDKPMAIIEIGPLVRFWTILALLCLGNAISLSLPITKRFYVNTAQSEDRNDPQVTE